MMKKNFKRIAAAILILSMGLTGCSKSEKTTQDVTKEPTKEATQEVTQEPTKEPEKELEEKKIQIMMLGPGKQKDSDEVWSLFNEKLKEYVPNTTVEFTVVPGAEYKDTYNRMMASGEKIDLAWAGFYNDISQDIKDGNLMPLNDLVAQYGQDIVASSTEKVIDYCKSADGNLYYIPNWQGMASGRVAMKIPTELAKLAGDDWLDNMNAIAKTMIADPSIENIQKYYDEFAKYPQACLEAGKLYGGLDANLFIYDPTFKFGNRYVQMNGVGFLFGDDSFVVKDMYASDTFKQFAENMANYYIKGYFRSDIASMKQEAIANGEFNNNTTIARTHNAFSDNQEAMDTGTSGCDMSLIRLHDSFHLDKGTATTMVIPYCADEPERAMMVLNALYANPDLYQLLVYGEEGKHYTDNGDGTVTTPYGTQGTADSDYGLWKWTIATCKNSLVTQGDVKGYYDELVTYETDAYASPFANFQFDNTSVSGIITALSAIEKEYLTSFQTGVRGADWEKYYEQFMKERKDAGVDELIAEYQKQIDAYVKEQNITSWNYTNK